MVTPQYSKVFKGKGMPIYNDDPLSPLMMNHSHGDFVLMFQIEFPKKLSQDKKDIVASILEPAY